MNKTFQTKVAGVAQLKKRQTILKRLAKADDFPEVSLVREPDNKHDENAIKVIIHMYNEKTDVEQEVHIGYIAAHVAASLSKDLDRGYKVIAWIDDVLGGSDDEDEDMNYGLLISVDIDRTKN